MIHFVTGTPGAGKTYYLLRQIVWFLERTDWQIVTNVPVRWSQLYAWCAEHGFERDLSSRVTVLTGEETRYFWRYRGLGEVWGSKVTGKVRGTVVETEVVVDPERLWPVVFLVMEFHQFFSVRDWGEVAPEAVWYASQHRKYGDEVYCDSQHPEMIAKQWRILVQDWTYLRNYQHETWLGVLRGPRRVRWHKTLFPVTSGEVKGGLDGGMYVIDVRPGKDGLADCYDTAGGVGVVLGAESDKGHARKGVWWGWGVVGFLALVTLVMCLGPLGVGHVIRWVTGSFVHLVGGGVRGGVVPVASVPVGLGSVVATAVPRSSGVVPAGDGSGAVLVVEDLTSLASYQDGRGFWHVLVGLKGGHHYEDGEVEEVRHRPDRVRISGVWHKFGVLGPGESVDAGASAGLVGGQSSWGQPSTHRPSLRSW